MQPMNMKGITFTKSGDITVVLTANPQQPRGLLDVELALSPDARPEPAWMFDEQVVVNALVAMRRRITAYLTDLRRAREDDKQYLLFDLPLDDVIVTPLAPAGVSCPLTPEQLCSLNISPTAS